MNDPGTSNRRNTRGVGAGIAAAALLVAGLVGVARAAPGSAKNAPPAIAEWTIFVYGHGDNNLSAQLIGAIEEMGEASLGTNVNVLVAADYCAGNVCRDPDDKVLDPVHGKPITTGTQYMRIQGDGKKPLLVAEVPEQNLDEPEVLRAWVARTFRDYPARRHAVFMNGHGGSWGGFGGDRQDGTLDDTRGLEIDEIDHAIRAGMRDAGLPEGSRLDLLVFDACLMAGSEVLWQFHDLARIIIADAESDASELGRAGILTLLSASPDVSTSHHAVMDLQSWEATHADVDRAAERLLRARAAFDMERFGRYAADMKTLADLMLRSHTLSWTEVARANALTLPPYGAFSLEFASNYLDAGQFLGLLGTIRSDPDVAAAATKARQSLRDATIRTSLGTLRAAAGQSGLQIAGNRGESWDRATQSRYSQLSWDRDVGWGRVLSALDAASEDNPPEFQAKVSSSKPGTARIEVTPTSDGVVDVIAFVARRDPDGNAYRLGGIWNEQVAAGKTSSYAWDGKVPVLVGKDGKGVSVSAEPLFLVPGQDPPLQGLPAYLKDRKGKYLTNAEEEPQEIRAYFDSSGRLQSLLVDANGRYGVWDPELFEDDWSLVPILQSVDGRAVKPGKAIALVAASMPRLRMQPATGDLLIEVIVRDVWGHASEKTFPLPRATLPPR